MPIFLAFSSRFRYNGTKIAKRSPHAVLEEENAPARPVLRLRVARAVARDRPECRNVPVTVGDKTVTAYVQINHFVMMLQDGLLMEEHFFDVCSHFQRAGYHVIWLMRCTQDIENGYLKLKKQRGDKCLWKWRKPTTNFGRWTSDNRCVTILLQYKPAPDGPLEHCTEHILQRVQWAESSDNAQMVPSRTEFATVGVPGTPAELANWLRGGFMSGDL